MYMCGNDSRRMDVSVSHNAITLCGVEFINA